MLLYFPGGTINRKLRQKKQYLVHVTVNISNVKRLDTKNYRAQLLDLIIYTHRDRL